MYKRYLFIFLLIILSGDAFSQVPVIFRIVTRNTPFQLNSSFSDTNGTTIQVETLKFYISGIELYSKEQLVWKEPESYHLLDASSAASMNIALNAPLGIQYNTLRFNLGIDSLTNVSGAMGGDLDPTHGMYWTWQSGYINFKLEGQASCEGRRKEFQYHLGGYQNGFNAIQTISLRISQKENIIDLDLEKLFSLIDYCKQPHIMSPGKTAVAISKTIAALFTTKP
jgi:hypothetical protein